MNPSLTGVSAHMRDLGTAAIGHAIRHAATILVLSDQMWDEISVLHAAHAAEILVKARIAEEHPLLIFEQLPRPDPRQPAGTTLELKDLFAKVKTLQYHDLPSRLWATTGLRVPDEQRYVEFGQLRNSIQHFASPPDHDLARATLEFIFGVIDPFINDCWGLFAIDYHEFGGPAPSADHYYDVVGRLAEWGIKFLVSPKAAAAWTENNAYERMLEGPDVSKAYRREMTKRIMAAAPTRPGKPVKPQKK